ncbi:hypothetical protein IMG5_113420 [Ichthyophthirius multifiliis]|uniref:Transcription factor CBF/NF-Y/archaeal histone domain-containing protein n=1 Tax=Ichthyophthirius multifiliis TaxID=5932 RepID=G0QU01_ICHMU|nr:hypothetical protein IMG5_113420 [Ichthyophthirius multifiliis]EGR31305.1 hypothetical protein IMG5_113420 [Ichthyophthirius multifiliis]|eukprot:XP_004034791.1 hypothetical protein IMG5_113420 [Ichthyophthirius multifiliis]
MEGDENLPRATINAFVRENLKGLKCSNEFINYIIKLSKDYIYHISDDANRICLQEGKKTISPEYIYKSLRKNQLDYQIPEIDEIKKKIIEENLRVQEQNELLKDPDYLRELSIKQELIFEQSRLMNTAELKGLDKLENTQHNFESMELSNILLVNQKQNGSASKSLKHKQQNNDNIEEEDDDDYEN